MSGAGVTGAARAWYREPLVWLLVALPLAAVVGGITTIVLAVRSEDGLVVDDYYRQGLAINAVLDRDRRAAALGLAMSIRVGADGRSIVLHLAAPAGFRRPPELALRLSHATRSGFDRQLTLRAAGDGDYRAALRAPLPPGHWYAEIGNDEWRLVGSLRTVRHRRD